MDKKVTQQLSMGHWNENSMIVVNIRTTGPDSEWHEILQFSAILLDSNCQMYRGVLPFNSYIKPSSHLVIDPNYVSKELLNTILTTGIEAFDASDYFVKWLEKLPWQTGRSTDTPKQAFALGYDLSYQMPFIRKFVSAEIWDVFFHQRTRDILATSLFLNDCCGMGARTVPFSKNELYWLASRMHVERLPGADALQDCLVIARTYEAMLRYYAFNSI